MRSSIPGIGPGFSPGITGKVRQRERMDGSKASSRSEVGRRRLWSGGSAKVFRKALADAACWMHIRSASRISATFKGARCGLRKRGAFQLMNLGKGDTPKLGLRPKKEEIWMTFGIWVEQVGGQTATQLRVGGTDGDLLTLSPDRVGAGRGRDALTRGIGI